MWSAGARARSPWMSATVTLSRKAVASFPVHLSEHMWPTSKRLACFRVHRAESLIDAAFAINGESPL
jgi:hypothetical protein